MMNLDSGNLTVYLSSAENITAFIGESAKIEVAQAINYIESGKAELRPLVLETKEYKQEAVSSASAALTSAVNAQNSANSAAESAVIAQTAMSGKQDTISDLSTIRSGAALGVTALQPNDNISKLQNDVGYITGITSADVTTALGYTPYDASNPNGYTSNVGTVTSVNNVNPVNGNVTISIPSDTGDLTNGAGFITSTELTPYALNADLATVATSGSYSDLSGTPTIPTVNNPTITITQGGTTKGSFTLNQTTGDTIELDAGGGGGGSYTAGDGIIIQNDVISVDDEPIDEADTETVEEVTITYLLSQITGYDATKTQTLKHINGILTWVTEV